MEKSKEYIIEITEDTKAYIYLAMAQGTVTMFVVKLLVQFQEVWHEILRYDSGHDCPHKDILDTEGAVVRKVWYDFLDNGQALTMAITDIKDNHEFYKERYEKWLKKQRKKRIWLSSCMLLVAGRLQKKTRRRNGIKRHQRSLHA